MEAADEPPQMMKFPFESVRAVPWMHCGSPEDGMVFKILIALQIQALNRTSSVSTVILAFLIGLKVVRVSLAA